MGTGAPDDPVPLVKCARLCDGFLEYIFLQWLDDSHARVCSPIHLEHFGISRRFTHMKEALRRG